MDAVNRRAGIGLGWGSGSMVAAALLAGPFGGAAAAEPPERQKLPSVELLMLQEAASSEAQRADWTRAAGAFGPAPPRGLKLGLQWRGEPVAGHPLHAQLWRRVAQGDDSRPGAVDEPLYGARVEMPLSPERRLSLRDLLGMELDNGAKLSLGRKNGRVSVYYRVQF